MIDITKVLLLQLQCNWQWGGKIANTQNFTTGDQMKWCQGACILHTQKHYCSKSLKIKSQKYSNSRLRSNKQIKFHKGKKNILLNIFCRKEALKKSARTAFFVILYFYRSVYSVTCFEFPFFRHLGNGFERCRAAQCASVSSSIAKVVNNHSFEGVASSQIHTRWKWWCCEAKAKHHIFALLHLLCLPFIFALFIVVKLLHGVDNSG